MKRFDLSLNVPFRIGQSNEYWIEYIGEANAKQLKNIKQDEKYKQTTTKHLVFDKHHQEFVVFIRNELYVMDAELEGFKNSSPVYRHLEGPHRIRLTGANPDIAFSGTLESQKYQREFMFILDGDFDANGR